MKNILQTVALGGMMLLGSKELVQANPTNSADGDPRLKSELVVNFSEPRGENIESKKKNRIEEIRTFMIEFNKLIRANILMIPGGSGSNRITFGKGIIYISLTESSGSFGTNKKYFLSYIEAGQDILVYHCEEFTNTIQGKSNNFSVSVKSYSEECSASSRVKKNHKLKKPKIKNYNAFSEAQGDIDKVKKALQASQVTPEKK